LGDGAGGVVDDNLPDIIEEALPILQRGMDGEFPNQIDDLHGFPPRAKVLRGQRLSQPLSQRMNTCRYGMGSTGPGTISPTTACDGSTCTSRDAVIGTTPSPRSASATARTC